MKEQKTKKSQKFTGKCYWWLRNLLWNYSCLNLIGQKNLRAFLNMILIFSDLWLFSKDCNETINPDDAQNVRKWLN